MGQIGWVLFSAYMQSPPHPITLLTSCGQMFNVQIVGLTNAAAAGFGNMGAGVAELFMPLVQGAIADNVSNYEAWRW